jgi:multicomponent Na+:H+ antiporter subunit B
MVVVFGVFLLTLLLITAFAIVRAQNLFVAVMLSGIFSLLMALNFFLLDAADVALTEAAVGAGISTVLFLGALALTSDRETSQSSNRLVGLIVSFVTIVAVIYGTFDQPRFADPNAPVQVHVSPWYLETTRTDIDIPNAVTAVLASFRGYDTLGEVLVVYTAGLGVLFLLGQYSGRREEEVVDDDPGLRHYLIPRMVGRMLIPFILLFGLYVQFHGDFGPGGGFQAGAIIAAAIILFALLEGEERALQVLPKRVLTWLMAGGALLYGGVGVVCMLMGGNFLDYNVLADNPITGQHIGIIVIEAGVGLTVTGVMLSIYHAFAARGNF